LFKSVVLIVMIFFAVYELRTKSCEQGGPRIQNSRLLCGSQTLHSDWWLYGSYISLHVHRNM